MRDYPATKPEPKHRRAVFLDRDGTINEDAHYPHDPEDLRFCPGALEGLKILAKLPLDIIIVSNQPGIAYGFYTETQMQIFNEVLFNGIHTAGGRIDSLYYCPHHGLRHFKEIPKRELPCYYSKPFPGMLLEAARDWEIDLSKSFMIGDRFTDIVAGQLVGCHSILVQFSGANPDKESKLLIEPNDHAITLEQAANIIELIIRKEIFELLKEKYDPPHSTDQDDEGKLE